MRALLTSLFFFAAPVFAWDSNLQLAAPAPVVDEAGLISRSEEAQLSRVLAKIKANTGIELSVYIADSLQGRGIEDFSMAVAEKWGLGTKKEDKGLLFVIAPKERKMRFEVGYGLEGDLPDSFVGRVLDNEVRPRFRDGQYYDGILAGIIGLQDRVSLGLAEEDGPPARRGVIHVNPGSLGSIILAIIFSGPFLFFLFIFLVIRNLRRRLGFRSGHRRHWGSGGSTLGGLGGWGGGGSWSGGSWSGGSSRSSWGGGGGGFGGGGASSGW